MLIALGTLIILTPFSGLPIAIRTSLIDVFGACVLSIGLSMRSREAHRAHPQVETPSPATPLYDVSPK